MTTMTGIRQRIGGAEAARAEHGEFEEPRVARWLFGRTESAWIWLLVRLYIGWQWLAAGTEKLQNPQWANGAVLSGFIRGALAKTTGANPDVQGWYAAFLRTAVLPHTAIWAPLVAFGETIVGIALILGLFTGIAAFFGSFMNVSYLLAGTVSINPILFVPATFLVLAWRVGGWWGLDRWILPAIGTPWHPGRVWHRA